MTEKNNDQEVNLAKKMEEVNQAGCDFCVGTSYQAVESEDAFAQLLKALGKDPAESEN
ncbi:hypothetical protein SAMN04487985_10522 [Aerococcus urinaehominis]|uniref:hypothetical protein n=1 Tax=Aerococcus urinaehominis TaxID=128944 RepID=UPI000886D07F|nr:hypothetical protein [Aerococcus urinaehominis]SDM09071.1 hypothetical protein SAMN04487985_10522 [Aerococcus urinaehominis]